MTSSDHAELVAARKRIAELALAKGLEGRRGPSGKGYSLPGCVVRV